MCSWRAGCGGIRKSGSEGSGEETTGRKTGTGASPPTHRDGGRADAQRRRCFAQRPSMPVLGITLLPLGASTSDELLGAAEVRTPAFLQSAPRAGDSATVAAISAPAGVGFGACFHAEAAAGRLYAVTAPFVALEAHCCRCCPSRAARELAQRVPGGPVAAHPVGGTRVA